MVDEPSEERETTSQLCSLRSSFDVLRLGNRHPVWAAHDVGDGHLLFVLAFFGGQDFLFLGRCANGENGCVLRQYLKHGEGKRK